MTTEQNGTQIGAAIKEAQLEVARKGYKQANTNEILLASFGWLGERMTGLAGELHQDIMNHNHHNSQGNPWGNKKMEVVVRIGGPAAVGAGVMGALVTLIEKLVGG